MATLNIYLSGETAPAIVIKYCDPESVVCEEDKVTVTRDGELITILCEYAFVEEVY